MSPSSPATPGGPAGPGSPTGPCTPSRPVGPLGPFSPCGSGERSHCLICPIAQRCTDLAHTHRDTFLSCCSRGTLRSWAPGGANGSPGSRCTAFPRGALREEMESDPQRGDHSLHTEDPPGFPGETALQPMLIPAEEVLLLTLPRLPLPGPPTVPRDPRLTAGPGGPAGPSFPFKPAPPYEPEIRSNR